MRTSAGERRLCLIQTITVGERVGFLIRDPNVRDDAVERLVRSESGLRAVLEASPDSRMA